MMSNEKEILSFSRKNIEIMKENKKLVSKDWSRYYKYFVGKFWKTDDPVHPRPVTNFCFSSIRSSVALLTDNNPIIMAYPVDKSDIDKSNLISRILVNIWDKNNCMEKLSKALYDAHIFGTGFWKVVYDPVVDDVAVWTVPPEYIFVDPMATSIENCKMIAQIMPMPISELQVLFGESRWASNLDELRGDSGFSFAVDRQAIGENKISTGHTTSFKDTTGLRTTEYHDEETTFTQNIGKNTIVEELWYWDNEENEFCVITTAEDKLLDYKKGGDKLPFVPFYNFWDSNRFWGTSEISIIGSLNRDYNILKAVVLDHIRLVGNTPWIVDSNAGIEIEHLSNLEGLVITKRPGSEVRRDPPPSMPPDAFRMLSDIKFEIDTLTGIHDVMQGRRPVGLTAGIAIAELQEAAQVPIREKMRRVQYSLNRAAKIIFGLVQKHYRKQRVIRIISGAEITFRDINPSDIQKEYDIIFDIESQFGQTRSSKIDTMLKLYGMQLVDRRAVHEAMGLPDREEIMKRMAVTQSIERLIASGQYANLQTDNQADINAIMNQMPMSTEEMMAGAVGK